jgi:hypothetical protein
MKSAEEFKLPWPDPTPEMLRTPRFEAVWQCIKKWDINVPNAYGGYCGATGNHVRAILDALNQVRLEDYKHALTKAAEMVPDFAYAKTQILAHRDSLKEIP